MEGLNGGLIIKLAENLHRRDEEKKLGSIRLLARILQKNRVSESDVQVVIKPLDELWSLRSQVVSHAGKINLPATDLKEHFRQLVEKCDRAMRKLAELVLNGILKS